MEKQENARIPDEHNKHFTRAVRFWLRINYNVSDVVKSKKRYAQWVKKDLVPKHPTPIIEIKGLAAPCFVRRWAASSRLTGTARVVLCCRTKIAFCFLFCGGWLRALSTLPRATYRCNPSVYIHFLIGIPRSTGYIQITWYKVHGTGYKVRTRYRVQGTVEMARG